MSSILSWMERVKGKFHLSFPPYGQQWHRWGVRPTTLVAWESNVWISFEMLPSCAFSCAADDKLTTMSVVYEVDTRISFGMPLSRASGCVVDGRPMVVHEGGILEEI